MVKRMSLKVSEELYRFISDEAEKRCITMNAVIVFALEQKQQEQLKQKEEQKN